MDGSTAKDAFVVLSWSLLSIKCCNEISDKGGKDTCLLYVWSTRGFGTGLVRRWLVGRLPLSSLNCSCVKCGGSGGLVDLVFGLVVIFYR